MTMAELKDYLFEQGIGAGTLDDIVHDAASEMASSANNYGLSAQLHFLHVRAGWDADEILTAVKGAVGEQG
jgi:hypothetical protein